MNQHGAGPAGSGDQLREAVQDLYAVLHYLEAPYQLSEHDWLDAHDGLAHVVLAAERLAATLLTRCPETGRKLEQVDELAAARDLLRDANKLLSRPEALPD